MKPLMHDAAFLIADNSFRLVERILHPEARLNTLHTLYEIARAGIEAFYIQQSRHTDLLKPMSN